RQMEKDGERQSVRWRETDGEIRMERVGWRKADVERDEWREWDEERMMERVGWRETDGERRMKPLIVKPNPKPRTLNPNPNI
ncbi:hypothetical protein A2U01_0067884, partial [Trifolium medium]|nr:hypothetical protein [Trifolium medium]